MDHKLEPVLIRSGSTHICYFNDNIHCRADSFHQRSKLECRWWYRLECANVIYPILGAVKKRTVVWKRDAFTYSQLKKKIIDRNGKGRNLWFSHSHLHTIICMHSATAIKVTAWVVNHLPWNRHNSNNFKLQVLLRKLGIFSKQLFKGKEYSAKYSRYLSP